METFALLMLVVYKWAKFSIMTELADSFAYVAFWPKSRKWLLALFIDLNSIIVSELMNSANRSRFTSASEIPMYSGIAPVMECSGQNFWVHWRYQCSKLVRQSFIEWAAKSVHQSYWAGIYYQQQRSKGNTHQSSIRSLAFKWIRVLYRCWKTKEPYNESKYLKALRDRNSPLLFKEKAC